jgi:hypothetical protein
LLDQQGVGSKSVSMVVVVAEGAVVLGVDPCVGVVAGGTVVVVVGTTP